MSQKSDKSAELSRNLGNKYYAQRNFFDALIKYNESLCHSPGTSESASLAYANRSAVYFELKIFNRCLKNIELAQQSGYPERNLSTLEKRAAKCRQQIEAGVEVTKEENPFDRVKLCRAAHEKLPFVVNCLELGKSKKFGRFIATNRNLRAGDVIAIEKPHFKTLKSDSRYDSCEETNKFQRCANCLRDNLLDLIPCLECSSSEIENVIFSNSKYL